MSLVLLGVAALLVAANAFFVAAEFAIVKVRLTKLEELHRQGVGGSANALVVSRDLDRYLSATQLGITLASLGLGWIGEPAVADLLRGPLGVLHLSEPVLHSVALTVAFALITIAHIVLGELAPKSLAILRPEQTTLVVARPLRIFYWVFLPFIWVLNGLARLLLGQLGLSPQEALDEGGYSERELRIMLARSSAETSEQAMRALSLPELHARHLMIPRNQVELLDAGQTLDEARPILGRSGHSRFPVVEMAGDLDSSVGIVLARDIVNARLDGRDVKVGELARDAIYVHQGATAVQILHEFREQHGQMALVVDEHGGVAGIVTLADIVMELLGPLSEENDARVSTMPPETAEVIDGATPLLELAERIGVELHGKQPATAAGYLIEKLRRFPRKGDHTTLGEHRLVVEEVVGPKVVSLRVVPAIPPRG